MRLRHNKCASCLLALLSWATLPIEAWSDFVVDAPAASPGVEMTFEDVLVILTIHAQATENLTGYTTFTFLVEAKNKDDDEIGSDALLFTTTTIDGFNQTAPNTPFLDDNPPDPSLDTHVIAHPQFSIANLEVDTGEELSATFTTDHSIVQREDLAQIVLKDGAIGLADLDFAVRRSDGTIDDSRFNLQFVAVPEASAWLCWSALGILAATRRWRGRRRQSLADVARPLSSTSFS